MAIQIVGQWALIVCGVLLFILSCWLTIRKRALESIKPYLLGFVIMGVGAFGLPFLKEFSPYLKTLEGLSSAKEVATYSSFFDQVASGRLPVSVARAGLAITLERPLPGMEAALDRAITAAGTRPEAKLLTTARQDLQAREAAARDLVAGAAAAGAGGRARLEQYDPSLKRLMVKPLERLSTQEKAHLQINQNYLRDLATAGR